MSTREELAQAERIVVKLGTGVVTHGGIDLALGRVHGLIEELAALRRAGKTLVLVSSGAVAMGSRALGLRERPRSLGLRQAAAAVGQGRLISLYTRAFGELGIVTAQVLLTQEDLGDRDRALGLRTTLMRLLELGTLPILNENDSVSVRDVVEKVGSGPPVAFGDNDGLSARVAVALDADLLVLCSDVDGVWTDNPKLAPTARRIPEIFDLDAPDGPAVDGQSASGTGGMASKLAAARLCAEAGTTTLIIDGTTPGMLPRALAGADVGTRIHPRVIRRARDRLIAFAAARRGALIIDTGAVRALAAGKASLLPIGVTAVEGEFDRGDVVEIRDLSGRVHGRGIANYPAGACRALLGRHSDDIASILGYRGYDALVSRDNLVLSEV